MRYVIGRVLEAMVVLFSIVVLGVTVPMSFSIILALFNEMPVKDYVMTEPFWIFSIVGMFLSMWYMFKIYEDKAKLSK